MWFCIESTLLMCNESTSSCIETTCIETTLYRNDRNPTAFPPTVDIESDENQNVASAGWISIWHSRINTIILNSGRYIRLPLCTDTRGNGTNNCIFFFQESLGAFPLEQKFQLEFPFQKFWNFCLNRKVHESKAQDMLIVTHTPHLWSCLLRFVEMWGENTSRSNGSTQLSSASVTCSRRSENSERSRSFSPRPIRMDITNLRSNNICNAWFWVKFDFCPWTNFSCVNRTPRDRLVTSSCSNFLLLK